MVIGRFDPDSFAEFVGQPTLEVAHHWGMERHYSIGQEIHKTFKELLQEILYHHHSSFGYEKDLTELGFPKTAQALLEFRSGLPNRHETQMGNFAEVIGAEYGKNILGYETMLVFPKRINPNTEQSMKGADILGLPNPNSMPSLLFGEAKCYETFRKESVGDSHRHLVSLWRREAPRLLAFTKELLKLEANANGEASLDTVYYSDFKQITQSTLILIINQNAPRNPFEALDMHCTQSPLPNLVAVHIQIIELNKLIPLIFSVKNR